MNTNDALVSRYRYGAQYIKDYETFRAQILNKTIVPYQVEFQPPPRSKSICWLECPYCYGGSAVDNGDRLSKERSMQLMEEVAAGGVRKIIFAGYATDPLNCSYIDDLLNIAINNKQIFGFNTKVLLASDRFTELLSRLDISPESYVSVSIDAGSNEVYNAVHHVKTKAKIYDNVLENVIRIGAARVKSGRLFDLSAAYLINEHNHDVQQVLSFIRDFRNAGCNMLRFTFAQQPRGLDSGEGDVPSVEACRAYAEKLRPIIAEQSTAECTAMLVDGDTEHQIFRRPRTIPCFARFTFPAVGFDGWLYHCSQSSSPNFRSMALGDLTTRGFWETFYDYDVENIDQYFNQCSRKMIESDCRCDRKEHVVNSGVLKSGVFDNLLTK